MSNKKNADEKKSRQKESKEYEKTIRLLEKENRRLLSEVKTLNKALQDTEEHLFRISEDKTVMETIQQVCEVKPAKSENSCPKCSKSGMKIINLGHIKLLTCTCGYRNRLNGQGLDQA